MTKVYGTGVYDFKRHRVAEYPVQPVTTETQPERRTGGGSITLVDIQKDRLTKIALSSWSVSGDESSSARPPFRPELVKEIYETELLVSDGGKTVPLQRVMILEVNQYLENYLWPNFVPDTASFEHVMSMILMINEKFRENVAAWVCFRDRKDVFKAFLRRVLLLKEQGRDFSIAEKTNYLLFMINAFQSLEDEVVRETVLKLVSLQLWHNLSVGRFKMELCLHPHLTDKWKKMTRKEAKRAKREGNTYDPTELLEVRFLRNLIDEFLEILDAKVLVQKQADGEVMLPGDINEVDDASVLYCERFVEFLIDLLSQLPTRREKLLGGRAGDEKPRMRKPEEIIAQYRKAGDASGAAKQARDKLLERGEKFERLDKRTAELESSAQNFKSMADELGKTLKRRKWWQI